MKKVLIVDDEAMSCATIREIIEEHFPQIGVIAEAGNGRRAVEKAVEIQPDIVIMDIEMPIMNGIEAAKKIREMIPECSVIFLTAYAEFHYARQAIRIGAEEFLLKPVDEEELAAVFRRIGAKKKGDWQESVLEKENIRKLQEPVVEMIPEPAEEDSAGKRAGDRSSMIVVEAKRIIDSNYMDDISVESLADHFQISASYFNRIFRQMYDISCKDYLIKVRVDAAKQYLGSPLLTVKEVGGMIGYPDPNYFTKVFRKRTGFTPTEYRNQILYQVNEKY
ncbi:MAG: response regulator [Lachnospiraceae bacterium]|nr:response regulator [Lachnospiraceae bacterium]